MPSLYVSSCLQIEDTMGNKHGHIDTKAHQDRPQSSQSQTSDVSRVTELTLPEPNLVRPLLDGVRRPLHERKRWSRLCSQGQKVNPGRDSAPGVQMRPPLKGSVGPRSFWSLRKESKAHPFFSLHHTSLQQPNDGNHDELDFLS